MNLLAPASSWVQILPISSRGLELTKCAWYLITWEFLKNGIPYINKQKINKTIDIKLSNDIIRRTIKHLRVTGKCKYLGVTLSPDSNKQSVSSDPKEFKNRIHHHHIQLFQPSSDIVLVYTSSASETAIST